MIFYIFFTFLLLAATFCAIQISITDFRRRIIPDAYLFPLMLIGLILITFFPAFPTQLSDAVIGATFGYTLTAIIGIIFEYRLRTHGDSTTIPIGMGDIKLISIGGLWLGTSGLSIALIIACATGAIWAYKNKQRHIPFAPFFLTGGFLSFIATMFLL
ncbi:MAG: prepilin peptidase [Alphaproteobacteria bacterium]|nr:prepilin peptidase [Alphaproteobacteria bacterium]